MWAAKYGRGDVVRLLVECAADVNATDEVTPAPATDRAVLSCCCLR